MPYQEARIQVEASQHQLEATWRIAEASLGSIFPDRVRGLFENDPDSNVPRICSFAMRPSSSHDAAHLRALVTSAGFADYRVLADLLESRGTHLLEVTTTHDQETQTRGMSFGIFTYGEFTEGTVYLLLHDVGGRKEASIQCETGHNDAGSHIRGIAAVLQEAQAFHTFPLTEFFKMYQSEP